MLELQLRRCHQSAQVRVEALERVGRPRRELMQVLFLEAQLPNHLLTCLPELLLVVLEDPHDGLARGCPHAETLRALGIKLRLKCPPLYFALVVELVLHSNPLLDLGPEHPQLALRKEIGGDSIVVISDSTTARLKEIALIADSGLISWLPLRALDPSFA